MPSRRRSDKKSHSAEILVVDDDPLILDLMADAIGLAGHQVDTCENGEEALRKNEAGAYQLIVTDMKLPGLDGLSLIKKLKAVHSDTDVIVITGYGSIENAVECMRAGALDYIIKPFSVDQIQVAVKKALEHRELRRRAIAMEQYRKLSYLDPLTGLYNRRFFDEALEGEIEKSLRAKRSLVLVMIDIDDFKVYNDCNGHQKGDAALIKMAKLFKAACRSSDIVARYGGEEFAIIFPGAGQEHAMVLGRRIVTEAEAADFEGQQLVPSGSLTVSIGVACFPQHGRNAVDLINHADQALYKAKKDGKNTIRMWNPVR